MVRSSRFSLIVRKSTGGPAPRIQPRIQFPLAPEPAAVAAVEKGTADSSSCCSEDNKEGGKYTWIHDLTVAVSTYATPPLSLLADILARGGDDLIVRRKLSQHMWYKGEGNQGSPLHVAARRGHAEAVRLIVEAGVPVDCEEEEEWYDKVDEEDKGDYRRTALYLAVESGGHKMVEVLRTLLDLGADPDRPCQWYGTMETPLDMARRRNDEHSVRILSEHKKISVERDKVTLQDHTKLKTLKRDIRRASEIDDQIAAEEEKVREHQKKIADLRKDKGYLTSFQKRRKIEEVDEIGVLKRTLLASEDKDDDDNRERDLSCPVCRKIPPKIFSCVECSNFLCEECLKKTTVCPTCRTDFSKKVPQRNIAAERLLLLAASSIDNGSSSSSKSKK